MTRVPIQDDWRRARQPPTPTHPRRAAALLMLGIFLALVLVSVVSVL